MWNSRNYSKLYPTPTLTRDLAGTGTNRGARGAVASLVKMLALESVQDGTRNNYLAQPYTWVKKRKLQGIGPWVAANDDLNGLLNSLLEFMACHCGQLSRNAHAHGAATGAASATKGAHFAHDERPTFHARSFKLVPLAVRAFGRFGADGEQLLNNIATSAAGKRGEGKLVRKGMILEMLRQNVSVALQTAISRQVIGVVRRANVSRHASVNRNGQDAAAPDSGDVGLASVLGNARL